MSLTFAGTLDHSAVTAAVDQFTDLVGSVEVAEAWAQESALPGMTVGGLVCHLVSQAECATEFVITPGPPDAKVLTLVGHYDRVDWLLAPVDAVENTSIRDDFNQMGLAGHAESVEALARSREHLAAAIDAAGPTTYVPWQDCALPTDDFLVVRRTSAQQAPSRHVQSRSPRVVSFPSEVNCMHSAEFSQLEIH